MVFEYPTYIDYVTFKYVLFIFASKNSRMAGRALIKQPNSPGSFSWTACHTALITPSPGSGVCALIAQCQSAPLGGDATSRDRQFMRACVLLEEGSVNYMSRWLPLSDIDVIL